MALIMTTIGEQILIGDMRRQRLVEWRLGDNHIAFWGPAICIRKNFVTPMGLAHIKKNAVGVIEEDDKVCIFRDSKRFTKTFHLTNSTIDKLRFVKNLTSIPFDNLVNEAIDFHLSAMIYMNYSPHNVEEKKLNELIQEIEGSRAKAEESFAKITEEIARDFKHVNKDRIVRRVKELYVKKKKSRKKVKKNEN